MTSSVSPVVVVGAREGRCPGVTTQRQARQQKRCSNIVCSRSGVYGTALQVKVLLTAREGFVKPSRSCTNDEGLFA